MRTIISSQRLNLGYVMCALAIQLAVPEFTSSDDAQDCLDNRLDNPMCIYSQLSAIIDLAKNMASFFLSI